MNYELKVEHGQVVGMSFVYVYFAITLLLGIYWVYKSNVKYKIEILILAFYLMTGNLNDLLTFAIPGISFFEIQPDRFLLLMFSFFLLRRIFFSKEPLPHTHFWTIPWFIVMLVLYTLFKIISLYSHLDTIAFSEVIIKSSHVINVLVIIYALRIIFSSELLEILGKAIIVGAIATCIFSFIQIGIDPMFARTGDIRIAYGDVIRANGIFNAEYFNSYFLIIASIWALVKTKSDFLKYSLIVLFASGIFLTFHRMSWVLFILVLGIYFLAIARPRFDKLLLTGLTGTVTIILLFVIFQREILNSTLVKERVTDTIDSRLGYYDMVFKNIGKKPVLGYGNYDNEVYYHNMLMITRMRDRATGNTGGIHSGYLSAMFYYGIPAFVFFTLFVVLSVVYFAMLFLRTGHFIFSITFFLALLYGLANITNSLLFSEYLGLHFAIYLGLGLGARYYYIGSNSTTTTVTPSILQQKIHIA